MIVTVSIVEFNTKDLLRECLKSILDQKWENEVKVWVIDNNSQDKSAVMIKSQFSEVKLIKSSKNRGFAGGQNLALKKIKSDFVLLLNPDTKIPPGSIDQMVEFMGRYPDCGISSCKLTFESGELQPNGGDLPIGFPLISWLFNLEMFGDFPNFHRRDENYYKYEREVGWVAGTFMMVRKEVFEKVGFFNEGYFMYFEDVELCLRTIKAGFKVMINPEVVVSHISGASSKNPRFAQWRGEFKGLIYFYKDHFGPFQAFFIKLLVFLSAFLRMVSFALLGRLGISKIYGQILFHL